MAKIIIPRNEKGQFIKEFHYSLKTEFQKGLIPWTKKVAGLGIIKANLGSFKKGFSPWNKGLPKEKQPCFEKQNTLGKHWKLSHKKILSEETKKKISEGNKGKHSYPYWLGKKLTEETKEKIRKSHIGEKHYRWNPDREMIKRNLRNDGEYKQWVKKVKKRDNNICKLKNENCSGYNISHHILDWSNYPELRYLPLNGISLCQAHHPRTNDEKQRLIPFFIDFVISQVK